MLRKIFSEERVQRSFAFIVSRCPSLSSKESIKSKDTLVSWTRRKERYFFSPHFPCLLFFGLSRKKKGQRLLPSKAKLSIICRQDISLDAVLGPFHFHAIFEYGIGDTLLFDQLNFFFFLLLSFATFERMAS